MKTLILASAFVAAAAAPAIAQTTVDRMSFPACLELVRRVSQQLGVAPINLVETKNMRVVRFCTDDGDSVLVTCNGLDEQLQTRINKNKVENRKFCR